MASSHEEHGLPMWHSPLVFRDLSPFVQHLGMAFLLLPTSGKQQGNAQEATRNDPAGPGQTPDKPFKAGQESPIHERQVSGLLRDSRRRSRRDTGSDTACLPQASARVPS